MKLTQNWVGYLDRSYEQIKANCLKNLTVNSPEITDHTESNILIVILSMFSGIAEMINLYIDSMAEEAFIGTARKYVSLVKHAKLLDYQIKARITPTVMLTFELYSTDTDLPYPFIPTTALGQLVLTKGIGTLSDNGLEFFTTQDGMILPNTSQVSIPAAQYSQFLNTLLGVTSGIAGQTILLPEDYVHKSITLEIDSILWSEADSLGYLKSSDLKFVVEIKEDGNAYIVFGDGISGAIPPTGTNIYGNYRVTTGDLGNVPPRSINTILATIPTPPNTALRVSNPDYASGGSDFESTDQIRVNAPKSIRTLNRAVTFLDYSDLAALAPGVKHSVVSYCCGKDVDLFISPLSRGIATSALLSSTRDFFEDKRMVTTKARLQAAGITRIYIEAILYGEPLFSVNEVYEAAVQALNDEYGYNSSEINRKIKVSSIITLLENTNEVNSLDVQAIYLEPYARGINTNNVLNISYGPIRYGALKTYRLIYRSLSNSFDVYKDGVYIGYAVLGQPFIDSSPDYMVSFVIQPGTYLNGNEWRFVVHPTYPESYPNYSIQVVDNSLPIFDIITPSNGITPTEIFGQLTVIINSTSKFTKPNC